jgi:hypothetical protein
MTAAIGGTCFVAGVVTEHQRSRGELTLPRAIDAHALDLQIKGGVKFIQAETEKLVDKVGTAAMTHPAHLLFTAGQKFPTNAEAIAAVKKSGAFSGFPWRAGSIVFTSTVFHGIYGKITAEDKSPKNVVMAAAIAGTVENFGRVPLTLLINGGVLNGIKLGVDLKSAEFVFKVGSKTAPLRAMYLGAGKAMVDIYGISPQTAGLACIPLALTIGAATEVIVNAEAMGNKVSWSAIPSKLVAIFKLPGVSIGGIVFREGLFMLLMAGASFSSKAEAQGKEPNSR